jgi:hypothetical protein
MFQRDISEKKYNVVFHLDKERPYANPLVRPLPIPPHSRLEEDGSVFNQFQ